MTLVFELPYPPSINHYWRRVGAKTLISRSGRLYRQRVVSQLQDKFSAPLRGPLTVTIHIYPPDRRRRDIDNLQKSLLDSLQASGLYADDSQINQLHLMRCDPLPPHGKVLVSVTPLNT